MQPSHLFPNAFGPPTTPEANLAARRGSTGSAISSLEELHLGPERNLSGDEAALNSFLAGFEQKPFEAELEYLSYKEGILAPSREVFLTEQPLISKEEFHFLQQLLFDSDMSNSRDNMELLDGQQSEEKTTTSTPFISMSPPLTNIPSEIKSQKEEEIFLLIQKLANTTVSSETYNQYGNNADDLIRRHNLMTYLKEMIQLQPQILLLSQAPSFSGSRLTGVPLTSEFIIMNPWSNIGKTKLFGISKGYKKTNETDKVSKDGSAKIVWKALAEVRQVPLLWSLFPFHSFNPERGWRSNRTPTQEEIKMGEDFLRDVVRIFNIQKVVALGKFVKRNLKSMGLPYVELSRPSYNGSKKFAQSILSVLQ